MNRSLSLPLHLHRTLEDSLLVSHIAVPLETCTCDERSFEVRSRMEHRRYDVMGLIDDGRITRYVLRSDLLRGRCGEYARSIETTDIVAAMTPLVELLPLFGDRDHLFVLEGSRLGSIVTRADLQKPPVRMLLFGLVSVLDMCLLDLVRQWYPDDSFKEKLSPMRLDTACKLYAERHRRNEEIDLADCLQFGDRRDLVLGQCPVETLGFDSKRQAIVFFKEAEALRNHLAHSQDLVVGTSWPKVIDLVVRLGEFLRRVDSDPAKLGLS